MLNVKSAHTAGHMMPHATTDGEKTLCGMDVVCTFHEVEAETVKAGVIALGKVSAGFRMSSCPRCLAVAHNPNP